MKKKEKEIYDKIINYCIIKDIDIRNSSTWSAILEENLVNQVWRGSVTKSWLYTMLHELGHLKIFNTRNYTQKNWKIIKNKFNYEYDIVSATQYMREEIEAWDAGYEIANYLNIKIDRKDYDKYASKYLMSYMKNLSFEYEERRRGRKRTKTS